MMKLSPGRWAGVAALAGMLVGVGFGQADEKDAKGGKGTKGKTVTAGEMTKSRGPVLLKKILEVTYAELERNPPALSVTAKGEVPTGGYSKPTLSRVVYVTPPEDGIQDYYLTAMKPRGGVPQVISVVEATNEWSDYLKEAPWIKGVRVHGVDEGVVEVRFGKK